MADERIEELLGELLYQLGYDTEDKHFGRTPERVASWLRDFTKNGDPQVVGKLLEVVFPHGGPPQDLVIVGPTEYHSMCAHHMLPVTGHAWVGYLPNEAICGLSKLSRVVEYLANQFTVQELVTAQIADQLDHWLKPRGVMVVVKAVHMCMTYRGIRDRDVATVTSAVRGAFAESAAARNEFLQLLTGFNR